MLIDLCIESKRWQEKAWGMLRRPYRKPTQVGEERILRCLREFWLRNSANWPRNFGIRGAFIYEGRSEKGVATVY